MLFGSETGVEQFHLTAIYDETLVTPCYDSTDAELHTDPFTLLLLQFELNWNWRSIKTEHESELIFNVKKLFHWPLDK